MILCAHANLDNIYNIEGNTDFFLSVSSKTQSDKCIVIC